MSLIWVRPEDPLPDPDLAPFSGLVAAGHDLSPARLQQAYAKGLFPWFGPGEPVLWWSPDPRMVLRCADFHISRSLAKRVRQFDRFASLEPAEPVPLQVTLNRAFDAVIGHCAQRRTSRLSLGAAREGQVLRPPADGIGRSGTWITPEIKSVYAQWHRQGDVHSVETWVEGRLVGGLYGVSLGGCFFGESMFSLVTDASKVALVYLVRYLQNHGVAWVDCQQETPHMARLGAHPVSRPLFLRSLRQARQQATPPWGAGRLSAHGTLHA